MSRCTIPCICRCCRPSMSPSTILREINADCWKLIGVPTGTMPSCLSPSGPTQARAGGDIHFFDLFENVDLVGTENLPCRCREGDRQGRFSENRLPVSQSACETWRLAWFAQI